MRCDDRRIIYTSLFFMHKPLSWSVLLQTCNSVSLPYVSGQLESLGQPAFNVVQYNSNQLLLLPNSLINQQQLVFADNLLFFSYCFLAWSLVQSSWTNRMVSLNPWYSSLYVLIFRKKYLLRSCICLRSLLLELEVRADSVRTPLAITKGVVSVLRCKCSVRVRSYYKKCVVSVLRCKCSIRVRAVPW
jgi:hypothetical protein